MTIVALFIAGALFVAYANGANDNFKGVATLYGSGTVSYRGALAWATLTTLAGSFCSILLAGRLVKVFSAKGLVPDAIAATPEFLAAVALGAALTVFMASMTGFPISTTHALTGGLLGAGLSVVGISVNVAHLGKSFLLPLLVSPVIAAILAGVVHHLSSWAGRRAGLPEDLCICVDRAAALRPQVGGTVALASVPALELTSDSSAVCAVHDRGRLAGVSLPALIDRAHFVSAGAVSFARGLNDTPKIVGLMLVLEALDVQMSLLLVAVTMAIGGLLHARKVAETLGRRITKIDCRQGFAANLVTSILVLTASYSGLPVSTTHVSCGSLFGIGLSTRQADGRVVRHILTSWALTLPIAGILAAGVIRLLQ